MRLLARDPFARESLERQIVTTDSTPRVFDCKWCGDRPLRLYYYRWVPDSGPVPEPQGPFCSVGCYRSYTEDDR